jgi:DNA helicase-2/ATP-dependent DNA helicase PcrA
MSTLPTCVECNEQILPGQSLTKTTVEGRPRYSHKIECSAQRGETEQPAPVDVAEHHPDLVRAEEVLASLDDEQRAAVVAPIGPVRILAGAGTGKTRALTHRIAYQHHMGTAPTGHVLAVTHSNRAAREMRERLQKLGVDSATAATFHAAALHQLREFWSRTELPGPGPQVLDDRGRSAELRAALTRVTRAQPGADQVRDLGSEVTWAAARRLSADDYEQQVRQVDRRSSLAPSVVAACLRQYARRKRDQEVLDFDDLLRETARLLEQDPEVALIVRGQHRHLLVDEYQDTDPAQQRLLGAWMGEGRSLCVVGDPNQSIYGFKGAEPGLIEGFTTQFADAVTVALVRDYRSTPQVVALANRIVAAPAATALVGQQPPGPEPSLTVHQEEEDETAALVERTRGLLADGVPVTEVAVLHRYHVQGVPIRAALLGAGVPVVRLKDDEKFFQTPAVRAALRSMARHDAAAEGLEALQGVLRQQGFDHDRPPEDGLQLDRHELLAALLQLARALPQERRTTSADLLAELNRQADQERDPTPTPGVTVGTIHAAKGLEWDAVLLPRMTDGSLPASFAKTPQQQAEEERLFYVAITRARRHLHLSRAEHAGGRSNRPSPFLDVLSPVPSQPQRTPALPTSGGRPSPSPRAPRPPTAPPWRVGERVLHDTYGMGKVVSHQPGAAVVDFGGSYGKRVIKATTRKMARLP